jgi:hypothetical protein
VGTVLALAQLHRKLLANYRSEPRVRRRDVARLGGSDDNDARRTAPQLNGTQHHPGPPKA